MDQNGHPGTIGIIGAILAFISPWLTELGLIVQIMAGIGGLILVGFGIYYKRLQIKKLKKELGD